MLSHQPPLGCGDLLEALQEVLGGIWMQAAPASEGTASSLWEMVSFGTNTVERVAWAPDGLSASAASTRCSSQSSQRPTISGTIGPPRATASECLCWGLGHAAQVGSSTREGGQGPAWRCLALRAPIPVPTHNAVQAIPHAFCEVASIPRLCPPRAFMKPHAHAFCPWPAFGPVSLSQGPLPLAF